MVPDATGHEAALAILCAADLHLVSSELLWLEASRTAIRLAHELPDRPEIPEVVNKALDHIAAIPLDSTTIATARALPEVIKSLDAIHVAAAESIREGLDCVVTCDQTMVRVLAGRGIRAVTPEAFRAEPGT
jgi:predicted nucleic acid-binding protein